MNRTKNKGMCAHDLIQTSLLYIDLDLSIHLDLNDTSDVCIIVYYTAKFSKSHDVIR